MLHLVYNSVLVTRTTGLDYVRSIQQFKIQFGSPDFTSKSLSTLEKATATCLPVSVRPHFDGIINDRPKKF